MKNFVLFGLVLNLFFFTSQHFFGMIKNLQISVHLALFSIPFTANTMVIFDYLLTIVKYDFLPITEKVDFGFTKTKPYNKGFNDLGYDSSNFIEILGSASIYIVLFPFLYGISVCVQASKL